MSLTVRAYNVLFGDCILVSWSEDDGEHHAWIDFGNLPEDRTDSFEPVFQDVLKRTGGKLDLVIATNGHSDHVRGFSSLRHRFRDRFEIDSFAYPAVDSEIDEALDNAAEHGSRTAEPMGSIAAEIGAKKAVAVHRDSDIETILPAWARMTIRVLGPEPDGSVYLDPALSSRPDLAPNADDPLFPTFAGSPARAAESELLGIPDFARLRRLLRVQRPEILAAAATARNNTSLVTKWVYQGNDGPVTLLFPGDAEEKSWEVMIRNAAGDTELSLEADFVKVADHGRPSGSPLQALNSVFPERANHRVLICADPTRFTGVNEVPSRQVVAGWRRRLRRASQLKQTSDKPEGGSVVFRLG